MNDAEGTNAQQDGPGGRSLVYSLLCMISFAFFTTLSVLTLTAALLSGTIAAMIRQYLPEHEYTSQQIMVLFVAVFAAHLTGVIGTWLLWRLRRTGFYILGAVCLLMAAVQLFIPGVTVVFTVVYIAFIFLFGLFFRRLS
jgi:hypothetical protein